jgi:hypothetical protein
MEINLAHINMLWEMALNISVLWMPVQCIFSLNMNQKSVVLKET